MKRLGCSVLIVVASVMMSSQMHAQATASSDIDPDAMTALTSMGTYLRSLKAFQVEAITTKDDVLDNGQQVQYDTHVDVVASMPDRFRISVNGPRQQRIYLYDGKTFTIFAQRVNYYAEVPAPDTVGKLASVLDEKYDIHLPLEDLFYWGTPRSDVAAITSAIDVGPTEVGGITCEQYAFRQPGLDWQIWIQLGDFPLPKKLVITTLTDEARPVYTAVLTWNLAPSYNDAAFQFDPPGDAHKIAIAPADASTGN